MNLPNTISAVRIAVSPVLAILPFIPSVAVRFFAFVLYLATAISDHWDGKIARTRGLVTDLGKILDPLADKLLLAATFVPMYLLQGAPDDWLLGLLPAVAERSAYPFQTWGMDPVYFPWWVLVPIVLRELFMTWFREFAKVRGVVIPAQALGKWKAGFQYTWMGAGFFWFGLKLLINSQGWWGLPAADFGTHLLGAIGIMTMAAALGLTLLSMLDYLRRYWRVFFTARV